MIQLFWRDRVNESQLMYRPAAKVLTLTHVYEDQYRIECLGHDEHIQAADWNDAKAKAKAWLTTVLQGMIVELGA